LPDGTVIDSHGSNRHTGTCARIAASPVSRKSGRAGCIGFLPRRSQVSAFCTELTGLTQADVDGGVDFATACEMVRDELRGRFRTWASWGEYDRRQFERQCVGGVGYPFGSRHINVKERFATAFGLRRGIGMSRALAHAGLPLEGRHHRGDGDAWNIAAIVAELARLGQPITE
jgi:inhibitor of KinA sporulation pathway (predicted exonuclease)